MKNMKSTRRNHLQDPELSQASYVVTQSAFHVHTKQVTATQYKIVCQGKSKSDRILDRSQHGGVNNCTHSDVTLELALQITPSHFSPQGSLDFFLQLAGRFDHFFVKDLRAAAAKGEGGTRNSSNQLYDQLLDTVSVKRSLVGTLMISWAKLLLADRFFINRIEEKWHNNLLVK